MSTAQDLSDDELAELTTRLRELLASLSDDVERSASRADTVHLDQTAVGRVSRVDAMQQQQMAAAEQRRTEVRLSQVRRALAAVDDGDYGSCRRCGEPIGYGRLAVRPETPFCMACATLLGA